MTNEEINALTDQQINVMMTATIKKISNYKVNSKPNGDYVEFLDCVGIVDYVKVEDYCNDPAAMMPIAFENNISIMKHKDYRLFTAFVVGEIDDTEHDLWLMVDYRTDDAKPCRAAAIVYLKMNGVL